MLKSCIKIKNNLPTLFIENQPVSAMAYTTYFEERSRYCDFIDVGYRIFLVNISFTTLSINTDTGFTPFRVGVFEDPNRADYSEFEYAVYKILKRCPDAIIFPRIYVSMPKWWIDSHPDDVVATPKGEYREEMFSDAFRKDGERMLIEFINHVKGSKYES